MYKAVQPYRFIKSALPDNPTLAQLVAFLGEKNERKLASNVMVRRQENCIVLSIFGNDIIFYYPTGDCRLSNRGFFTMTTRARLNQFMPKGLSVNLSRKGWTLTDGSKTVSFTSRGWYAIAADGTIEPWENG